MYNIYNYSYINVVQLAYIVYYGKGDTRYRFTLLACTCTCTKRTQLSGVEGLDIKVVQGLCIIDIVILREVRI